MKRLFIAILIHLLCITTLWATTPAFDNSSTGNGTDDFSFNHTTNCTTNCEMIVLTCVSTGGATSVDGVTYNSVALTQLADQSVGSSIRAQFWKLKAPSNGTHSLAVSVTNTNEASAAAVTYSNVNQTTDIGTVYINDATGPSTPSLTVTSATGEVVVDGVCTSDTVTMTASGGQTRRAVLSVANVSNGMSEKAGAASVNMSWTDSVANWVQFGVPLKPTSSGTAAANALLITESRKR